MTLYPKLMRNAGIILFWLSIIIAVVSVIASLAIALTSSMGITAIPAALMGGITAAVPPFVGAAIIWRLDIWLFERGDGE